MLSWDLASFSDPDDCASVAHVVILNGKVHRHEANRDQVARHLEFADSAMIIENGGRNDKSLPSLAARARILDEHAAAHLNNKQYDEALSAYQEALDIRREVFAAGHSQIAMSMSYIGNVYERQRMYDEALDMYSQALAAQEKTLPTGHLDIARSKSNIGNICQKLNQPEDALRNHQEALKMWMAHRSSGTCAADTAALLHNMAIIHSNNNDHKGALRSYKDALSIWEKFFPDGHPGMATTMNNLGNEYSAMGEPDKALTMFSAAIEMRKLKCPDNVLDLAATMINAAGVHEANRAPERALQFYREAYQTQKSELQPNDMDLQWSVQTIRRLEKDLGVDETDRTVLENQATVDWDHVGRRVSESEIRPDIPATVAKDLDNLERTGRFLELIHRHTLALCHQHKSPPKMTVTVVTGLGHAYVAKGRHEEALNDQQAAQYSFSKALEQYENALEITENMDDLRPGHAGIVSLKRDIAKVYRHMGKTDKALEIYTEDLNRQQSSLQEMAWSSKQIETIYVSLGMHKEAREAKKELEDFCMLQSIVSKTESELTMVPLDVEDNTTSSDTAVHGCANDEAHDRQANISPEIRQRRVAQIVVEEPPTLGPTVGDNEDTLSSLGRCACLAMIVLFGLAIFFIVPEPVASYLHNAYGSLGNLKKPLDLAIAIEEREYGPEHI